MLKLKLKEALHLSLWRMYVLWTSINMFKKKHLHTVRKTAVAKVSWLMLSNMLLFAELTEIRKMCSLLCIEKRAQIYILGTQYFRPQWNRRQQQVWGEKVPGTNMFQVILMEKRLVSSAVRRSRMGGGKHSVNHFQVSGVFLVLFW